MKCYSNEEILKRRMKKERISEKIKLIVVILITIIVIYNVSLIVQSILRPDKTPTWFGTKTFAIISGSMMPQIDIGDIVVVKEVSEEELKEGDIISFRRNDEIITHRIQKIEIKDRQKQYITKGDNNNTVDEKPTYYNNIEGKVVNIIPNIGYIAIFLKNKITILIIVFIFILMYIYDIKTTNKKMMREKKKELLNERRKE